MTADEQLVADLQRGCREAFAELLHRYRHRIYGFFRRRVQTAARASTLW